MKRTALLFPIVSAAVLVSCASDPVGTPATAAAPGPERVPMSSATVIQGGTPASGIAAIGTTGSAQAAIDSTRSGTVLGTTTAPGTAGGISTNPPAR